MSALKLNAYHIPVQL